MSVVAAMEMLGATGLFASRGFLTALLVALLLRFGGDPAIFGSGAQYVSQIQAPAWFVSDLSIAILAILAICEYAKESNEDARGFLEFTDYIAKPGMAALTLFAVVPAEDAQLLQHLSTQTLSSVIQGSGLDWSLPVYPFLLAAVSMPQIGHVLIAIVGAAVVLVLTFLRNSFLATIREATGGDDSLGIQKLINWMETSWVVVGGVLLLVAPLVVLLLVGGVFLVLWSIGKVLERAEKKAEVPCARCSTPNSPAAVRCRLCGVSQRSSCTVGFFGQAKAGIPAKANHGLLLLEKKQCPNCATRLRVQATRQHCPGCDYLVLEPGEAQAYDARVSGRLVPVLGTAFLLGWIPVVGAVAAILTYRLCLVAPYARYLTRGTRFGTRLLVRVVNFVLLLLSFIPLLGSATLPLMAYISYGFTRKSWLRSLANAPVRPPRLVDSESRGLLPEAATAAPAAALHP